MTACLEPADLKRISSHVALDFLIKGRLMLRFTALLVLLVIAPFRGFADDEAVTTFELDNGMQVVVVEDHRAPVVQHMVWYRAGSADECVMRCPGQMPIVAPKPASYRWVPPRD